MERRLVVQRGRKDGIGDVGPMKGTPATDDETQVSNCSISRMWFRYANCISYEMYVRMCLITGEVIWVLVSAITYGIVLI